MLPRTRSDTWQSAPQVTDLLVDAPTSTPKRLRYSTVLSHCFSNLSVAFSLAAKLRSRQALETAAANQARRIPAATARRSSFLARDVSMCGMFRRRPASTPAQHSRRTSITRSVRARGEIRTRAGGRPAKRTSGFCRGSEMRRSGSRFDSTGRTHRPARGLRTRPARLVGFSSTRGAPARERAHGSA